MSFYSEYRVDVVATIEGQPRGGIKQTSEGDHIRGMLSAQTAHIFWHNDRLRL